MQILKYLENRFINSSFKVKVELYLLVLIVFILVFYNIPIVHDNKNKNFRNNHYEIKEFNSSLLDINKRVEEYCLIKKIDIYSMANEKKEILILSSLPLSKVNSFILFLENINEYSNIKTLFLEKRNKGRRYTLEIKISFEEYFFKTLIKDDITKKSKIKKFKLKAIIDKNALINNKWLKVGEKINDYELINISNDSVSLSYDDKRIKLKVFKNDKY